MLIKARERLQLDERQARFLRICLPTWSPNTVKVQSSSAHPKIRWRLPKNQIFSPLSLYFNFTENESQCQFLIAWPLVDANFNLGWPRHRFMRFFQLKWVDFYLHSHCPASTVVKNNEHFSYHSERVGPGPHNQDRSWLTARMEVTK